MGLNETYSVVQSQIMLMQPLPTIKKAYALLCEEEKQRGLTEAKGINIVHAMNVKSYKSQSDAHRQTRQGSSSYSRS